MFFHSNKILKLKSNKIYNDFIFFFQTYDIAINPPKKTRILFILKINN